MAQWRQSTNQELTRVFVERVLGVLSRDVTRPGQILVLDRAAALVRGGGRTVGRGGRVGADLHLQLLYAVIVHVGRAHIAGHRFDVRLMIEVGRLRLLVLGQTGCRFDRVANLLGRL